MSPPTRRQFIAAASGTTLGAIARAQAQTAPPIRLGLVGCGGRGSMIADLAKATGLFTIAGAADYFQDRVAGFGTKFGLPEARCFTGLDGYRRLFEAGGLDAVAIESPPFFHPSRPWPPSGPACMSIWRNRLPSMRPVAGLSKKPENSPAKRNA